MQQTEKDFLNVVREIILEADRQENQQVKQDVDLLKQELLQKDKFYGHLDPYFQEKIKYLQQNFPHLFGPFLSTAIKLQIQDSQEEIIEALYPIIGKLVRKYISNEIAQLTTRIDTQLENTLSPQAWVKRISAFLSGEKHSESVMAQVNDSSLEEVFVIQNESGLLLGHYSTNNLIDGDMIAGMLTGIKSFVEHAFMRGPQDLQALEYEEYKIVVNSFPTYYLAFVTKGNLTPEFKNRLWDGALDFSSTYISRIPAEIDRSYIEKISKALAISFQYFNKK